MKELKQKKILGWGQSTIPDKMLVLANLHLYISLWPKCGRVVFGLSILRKKSGQSPVLETLRNDRVACLRFRRAECQVDGLAQTLRIGFKG
jgi:hypothetical protein